MAVLVEAGSGRGDGGMGMAGAPAGEEEEGEGEENERREEGDDGQGISALMSGEVRSPEAGGDEAAGSGARERAQAGAARSRALGRQGGSGTGAGCGPVRPGGGPAMGPVDPVARRRESRRGDVGVVEDMSVWWSGHVRRREEEED